jgi:predicted ATPase
MNNTIGETFQSSSIEEFFVDVLAYCRHYLGAIPPRISQAKYAGRYTGVFFLEPVPYVQDEIRKESKEEAALLHQAIWIAYYMEGYNPIRVPLFSTERATSTSRRVGFILQHAGVDRVNANELLH